MIGKKINQLATELAPVSTDLTIIGDPISGVSKKITLAQLGAIFSGAVSFYTNLAGFPALGDINVIYCAKDTKKLYLWDGTTYVEVFPAQALLDTYQLRSEKGVSNGYASLDVNGKVPIGQLPNSIMEYKGTWNAATNTPTLVNGTGDTGDVYICSNSGTVNFGDGDITFAVGDYVVYSGSIYQRSSGAVGTVTSVAVSRSGDALAITGSPITTSGTINIGFAGTGAQYIKGDGTLATFPNTIAQATNLITEVYNSTGATLTKGTVVYINGGQGNLPTVTKALATGDSTSAQTFGVVQADITNNNNGYVVVAGKLSDLDTQAYTEGTQLYLSSTTAGTWTSTKQYAPAHLVYVGIVVRSHPTQGIVEIKIQNGYELDELHDVAAQNPDNNDILQYKTSTSLWTKVAGTTSNIAEGSNLYYTDARSRAALSFTAGSGAYNSTTGVITIPTNTNQLTNGAAYITLASLSAGAGISYNNTTGVIASTITQYTDAMARASISLTTTGTSGAATYNSTTGVLNVPQYAPDLSGYVPTSRTLTINGTAYDLSANRSWSVGTVTSVGLSSATSGVTIGSTPITTSGTITLAIATASGSQQGLLSSTDWTTFNNKQNALTNPVTGTGTTNYLPKFTGTSTIGNSQIFDNGTNVGIGTASPSYKLEIYNAAGASAVIGAATGKIYVYGDDAGGTVGTLSLIPLRFATNGTEKMRLDASGNLGLGVTPSNAYADSRTFEIGANGILWSEASSSIYNSLIIGLNFYYNAGGTAVYKNSSIPSSRYIQYQGSHQWYNAPSGTAGNAISFTQAMTLNASGNLSIGNTNDTYKLDVLGPDGSVGTIRWANAGGRKSGFLYSDSAGVAIYDTNLNDAGIYLAGNTKMDFRVNGSIRLEIASTGAATFSSSVTATDLILGNGSNLSWGGAYGAGIPTIVGYNAGSGGALYFYPNGSTSSEKMRLFASGNLSIGNTNDTYKLDVSGTGRFTGQVTIKSGNGNQLLLDNAGERFTQMYFFNNNTYKSAIWWDNNTSKFEFYTGVTALSIASTGAATFSSSVTASYYDGAIFRVLTSSTFRGGLGAGSWAFADGTNDIALTSEAATKIGAGGVERMRITSGGNVGIGVTNPTEKLEVNGSIKTSAPFLGTAKPWKLGSVYTGTCVPTSWGEFASWATGTVIEVEIDGSTYRIPVVVDNYC